MYLSSSPHASSAFFDLRPNIIFSSVGLLFSLGPIFFMECKGYQVYPSKMKMPLLFHTLLLHCQSIHDDKMTSLGWSNANSWYRQSQSAVRPSARHHLQIPCLIISVVLSFMALSWLASLGSVRALQGD
jgi:hypothetical protein